VLDHVEAALAGVEHVTCVSPAVSMLGIPGIVEAQNLLIDKCVREGFDYLFLVQADVEVPEDSYKNLVGLGVDVAQGVVPRHDDREALIAGFMDEAKKVWYLPRSVVEGQILSGWVFAGLSCTLIKRQVLEAGIRFRYERGVGEDILFMYDVQSRGFVAKVHGGVLCGHLPQWPLQNGNITKLPSAPGFESLDVGCGHRAQGQVNVDRFPGPTAHRSADQRVADDACLDLENIPNFVQADGCLLPFRDRAFEKVLSWHLIEHVAHPELLLCELTRVSAERVEMRCPNGDHPSSFGESKPLHLHRLTQQWFEVKLRAFPEWDWSVRFEFSQGEPWEIVVSGVRRVYAA